MKKQLLLTAILLLSVFSFAQNGQDTTDQYSRQAEQIVRFYQGTLNALGSKYTPVKEKQIMINQSFDKIFLDDKVQIEDDLDENRETVTYKNVQAYLQDVDFFFKNVRFNFEIKKVERLTNSENIPFYKVITVCNIKGTTIKGEKIDVFKDRYFEINLNEDEQTLKIASIYTTKLNVEADLEAWWKALSPEWKKALTGEKQARDLMFVQIKGLLKATKLDISGRSIEDISPLSKFSALKKLNISHTNVVDLYPLRNLNKMEELDLSATKVKNINALQYMSSLSRLIIDSTLLEDISVLENMDSLKTLSMQYTKVDSLAPLEYLENIETLKLSGMPITNLKTFAGYTKVKVFVFDNTKVHSLSGIEKMKLLERISFSNTAVTDISLLKNFKNLKIIHFDNTKVSSLESLETLNPSTVYCDNTGITKRMADAYMQEHKNTLVVYNSAVWMNWWKALSPEWKKVFAQIMKTDTPDKIALHKLGLIKELDISGNEDIADLTPLSNLIHLEKIDISNTKVTNLSILSKLIELKEIKCKQTGITDLTPIGNLSNLEFLDISSTSINQLPLMGCNKLETLYADNTDINGLLTIANLKNLKLIYADNTKLNKMAVSLFKVRKPDAVVVYQTEELKKWWNLLDDNWKNIFKEKIPFDKKPERLQLAQMSYITELDLKNNSGITALKPLEMLTQLEVLKFTDTDVMDLTALRNLTNLTKLKCANNPIRSLEPVKKLTKLEFLDCSNTQVDDLTAISGLKELKILKITGTKVKNLNALENMHNLVHLEFSSTPVRWLKPIWNLERLQTLKCYNTKIMKPFMDKYKKAHPNVNVIF
ncbi:MAG: leucine-rich repeat domain-containing protein [Bacteroidales bacterium]|nr:leucine-rich repeat domain-containing protein [Bacteroidales bacterium]